MHEDFCPIVDHLDTDVGRGEVEDENVGAVCENDSVDACSHLAARRLFHDNGRSGRLVVQRVGTEVGVLDGGAIERSEPA